MAEVRVRALIEGGRATPAPPLGPSLAPLGVPIPKIIEEINDATKDFLGVKVPIEVVVNRETKAFEVRVGSPPTSALIKALLGLKEPVKEEPGVKGKRVIGNLTIEQALDIAEKKKKSMHGNLVARLSQIAGTCAAMGVSIEGMAAKDFIAALKGGAFEEKLKGAKKLTKVEEKG